MTRSASSLTRQKIDKTVDYIHVSYDINIGSETGLEQYLKPQTMYNIKYIDIN